MAFAAGGTLILSYTNGADRWELRVPVAEFDPFTWAYTGAGLKAPTESGLADTFRAFGGYWAPYFDPSWALTIEAVFWTSGGEGQRLTDVPTVASIAGTSGTPSSTAPPILRGFTFQLDNGERHVLRLFGIATDTIGARRAVSAASGGFDARDQALVGYLAGPATGLVAWDGQVFPPTAFAYQRYKLRPFEAAAPVPTPGADVDVQPGPDQIIPGGGGPGTVLTPTLGPDGIVPAWQAPCGAASCAEVPPLIPGSTDAPSVDLGRCGAALAMADYLEHLYGLIGGLVDSGISVAVGSSLSGMVSALMSIFFGPEAALPTFAIALPPLISVAKLVLGAASGFFPTLDSTENTAILRSCYQSLDGGTRALVVSSATISMWARRIEASSDLPAPEPKRLLELILAVPMVGTWQGKAYTGAQTGSTACVGFGVPSYAMNGGALLGRSTVSHALRGGAFMGMGGHRSVRGGGYYDKPLGRSLSGGATAS